LFAAGIAVFLAGYTIYAFFLGGIDGMPPLPEQFLRAENPVSIDKLLPPTETEIDFKLRMAFGKDCKEIKKRYKFAISKKGIVVAAADVFFNEPDGRVRLEDFSVAVIKDNAADRGEGKWPEINTITSDWAFLSFADEKGDPVKIEGPTDMSKGKISGAELRGHIVIINNRHTEEKHDDLEVMVDNEPLFYNEASAKIWTNGFVKLLDKQTQPHPTQISGHGMEMYLVREQPANKKQQVARAPKAKNDLSGVDRIELKSTVEMHLYSNANSDFMTGSAKSSAKSTKQGQGEMTPAEKTTDGGMQGANVEGQPALEKSHITITTEGPFVYDKSKEVARFDSPPAKQDSHFPDRVHVLRVPLRDEEEDKWNIKCDQLDCDVLTLKFHRETESATAPKGMASTDPKIESAQATARPGMDVVVSLDSENLHCTCQQLDYQCPTGERGARTVLRGNPLDAGKDGHKITSRELLLVSANEKGTGQQMIAQGPGQVDLYDNSPDPAKGSAAAKGYTTHATWKGLLTQTKHKEGNRDLDLLTLTEDAVFIDDEHAQKLYGQCLKVWLESNSAPIKATPAEPGKEPATAGPRQKPVKVEAYERVKALSPDFRIDARDRLTIRFEDVALAKGPLPDAVSMPSSGDPGPAASRQPSEAAAAKGRAEPVPPGARPQSLGIAFPAPEGQNKDKDKPKRPINLSASDVVVDVLRGADKNDLKELLAVGNVHVHQDGEKPEDKGVDIKGETLNLFHFVEGDIIKVFGDARGQAQLQLDETYLIGPKVTINQKENTAAVDGVGAMSMPSNTTFGGDKPSKPGTRMTVHWTRDMVFDGREAEFRGGDGGVVAYQDDSTMQCQTLQVTLDHMVSLKEGQKGDQKAKVEKVLANAKVCVLDNTKDDKGRPQCQRLICPNLAVDNLENQLNASGPGSATALQYETPGDLDPGKAPKQAKQATKAPELMLTRVEYQGQMYSQQLNDTTRKSLFLGNVVVVRVPANSLDAKVELEKLPKDGLLLQCDMLTVLDRKQPDGKKSQEMRAEKRVYCQTNDMRARAEVVTFDKNQDTMVLKGSPGNPATVWRQAGGPGSQWQMSQAQTILYNRKTNTVQLDSADVISGKLLPEVHFQAAEDLIVASITDRCANIASRSTEPRTK